VAVSRLWDVPVDGKFKKEAAVLLNITGGRLEKEYPLVPAEPRLRIIRKSLAIDAVQQVTALLD
jgi:hypothetical protein